LERLSQDFNVSCGKTALSKWYRRKAQDRLLEKIVISQKKKNEVLAKYKENPADTYNTLLEVAGQIAFDKAMETDGQLDAETIFNFTKLVMHGRKQAMEADHLELDKRRIALLEKKAAQADQAKGILESVELSEEQKANRMRELFGIST